MQYVTIKDMLEQFVSSQLSRFWDKYAWFYSIFPKILCITLENWLKYKKLPHIPMFGNVFKFPGLTIKQMQDKNGGDAVWNILHVYVFVAQ